MNILASYRLIHIWIVAHPLCPLDDGRRCNLLIPGRHEILFVWISVLLQTKAARRERQPTRSWAGWQTKPPCFLTFLSGFSWRPSAGLLPRRRLNWTRTNGVCAGEMAPEADKTKRKQTPGEKKKLARRLFTAAQATEATENKQRTAKNTAWNTLVGGIQLGWWG